MAVTTYPGAQLPWSGNFAEDKRFINILIIGLVLLFMVGVIVPLMDVPKIEREKLESLPPQLAKIVMEKKKIPPPPKPKPNQNPSQKRKTRKKRKRKRSLKRSLRRLPKKLARKLGFQACWHLPMILPICARIWTYRN